MYNTNVPTTVKVVYNNKLNTFRVLIAFNTTKVTVQNAVYISGDLSTTCLTSTYNFHTILATAIRNLRITSITSLRITKQAYSKLPDCDIADLHNFVMFM